MNKKKNALVHIVTDFGQDYNGGIVQHLITLYLKKLDELKVAGDINYVVYSPVEEFNITDGAYKTSFVANNINTNGSSLNGVSHGLLIVVDPTVGEQNGQKNRKALAFKLGHGIFGVAPDNGIITRIVENFSIIDARYIDQKKLDCFTSLGESINSIWDGYYTYSAALALLLATEDLDSVGYKENIRNKVKRINFREMRKVGSEYFISISGTDHNGNITLDTNVFNFERAEQIKSFEVYQKKIFLGKFYFKGSYVHHSNLDEEGNSLVAVSNPRLDNRARLELAISNKSLVKFLTIKFGDKISIKTGEEVRVLLNYTSSIRKDFKRYSIALQDTHKCLEMKKSTSVKSADTLG
ncbi:MAG: SAM-dependent chlorinase/fluorinase [Nanoarchaeota archaeon]